MGPVVRVVSEGGGEPAFQVFECQEHGETQVRDVLEGSPERLEAGRSGDVALAPEALDDGGAPESMPERTLELRSEVGAERLREAFLATRGLGGRTK